MQATSLWSVLFSLGEPCLIHFQRDSQSAVMLGATSPTANRQIKGISPFLMCKDNSRTRTFVDIETGDSWGEIIKAQPVSEDDQTDVLTVPSLGITQLPLSRFLDNMEGLYPGSKHAFRMRTTYGAHTWFPATDSAGAVVLECKHPQEEKPFSVASSILQALSAPALGTSGDPTEVFQPPHLDSDPNFQTRWPFSFYLKATHRTADDFDLEVTIREIKFDTSSVEEATKALAHAAIISSFVMNDTIHTK